MERILEFRVVLLSFGEKREREGEVVFQVGFGLDVLVSLLPFALFGAVERRAGLDKAG